MLSERALSQVAAYKYIAGPSTPLDRLMNHWWNYSVHGLPMWVAPNLVTLLGLLCMVAAAVVVVIQSPNCTDNLSPWVRRQHRCSVLHRHVIEKANICVLMLSMLTPSLAPSYFGMLTRLHSLLCGVCIVQVLCFCAVCLFVYQTLDAIDGKQVPICLPILFISLSLRTVEFKEPCT